MKVFFEKRYPDNRYEYTITIAFKSENLKINQDRKLDIFALFKKGNPIIAEKNNNKEMVGPLFCPMNMPSQWFWSKKATKIIENNTHMSNDHITNIISYITPFPFNAYLYCDIDTSTDKTFRIVKLGDCHIYRDSSSISSNEKSSSVDTQKKTILDNPYNNYYLFKLPPGKKIVFSSETEFNKPYIFKNEYDTDAQMEIKEIILFDIVDKSMRIYNPDQKFLYTDLEINKKSVTNTFTKMTNTCEKFRRAHIRPILPEYDGDVYKKLYKIAGINKEMYDTYYRRLDEEDSLSKYNIDDETHIIVSFSIIGSSIYAVKFMHDALVNLRRNYAHFHFNDSQFISEIINELIECLDNFRH
jgi:hypothetical protein